MDLTNDHHRKCVDFANKNSTSTAVPPSSSTEFIQETSAATFRYVERIVENGLPFLFIEEDLERRCAVSW